MSNKMSRTQPYRLSDVEEDVVAIIEDTESRLRSVWSVCRLVALFRPSVSERMFCTPYGVSHRLL